MRVAYCFVGHVRTYKHTHENFFKNVFSQMPGDIFIHTWDEMTGTTPAWWKTQMNPTERDIASTKIDEKEIVSIYSPKNMLVETQRSLLPVPWRSHLPYPAYTVKVVYESVLKAVNMAKNNDTYDRIFLTRMDINYLSKLDVNEFKSPKLFVPPMKFLLVDCKAASDLWIHGTQKDIITSANYFWEIEKRLFQCPDKDLFHEIIWHNYMRENGVQFAVSKMDFETVRMFGVPPKKWDKHYTY